MGQEKKSFESRPQDLLFPEDVERYRFFASADEIKLTLNEEKEERSLINTLKITVSSEKIKGSSILCERIDLDCCECDAKIVYLYVQESRIFCLIKFQNQHNHDLKMRVSQPLRETIKKQIMSLHGVMSSERIIQDILAKYQISEIQLLALLQEVQPLFRASKNFVDFFQELSSLKFLCIQTYQQPKNAHLKEVQNLHYFLVSSPKMIHNFNKYGQIIIVQELELLKHTKDLAKQPWKVILFTGMDFKKETVIFGLGSFFGTKQTCELLSELFIRFLKNLPFEPETIVTNDTEIMAETIKRVQNCQAFGGRHLFSCLKLIKQISTKLSFKCKAQQFRALLNAQSSTQYQNLVEKLYDSDNTAEQTKSIDEMLAKIDNYAQSINETEHFGMFPLVNTLEIIFESFKQKFVLLIRHEFYFQENILRLLRATMDELNQQQKFYEIEPLKYESYFRYSELKDIRKQLSKVVFQMCSKQLGSMVQMDFEERTSQQVRVSMGLESEVLQKEGQKWSCSCSYAKKSGLPCRHLWKLLIFERLPLSPYVHQRWIAEGIPSQKVVL